MKPEPVTQTVEQFTNSEFRCRVLTSHPTHQSAPLISRHYVYHWISQWIESTRQQYKKWQSKSWNL